MHVCQRLTQFGYIPGIQPVTQYDDRGRPIEHTFSIHLDELLQAFADARAAAPVIGVIMDVFHDGLQLSGLQTATDTLQGRTENKSFQLPEMIA